MAFWDILPDWWTQNTNSARTGGPGALSNAAQAQANKNKPPALVGNVDTQWGAGKPMGPRPPTAGAPTILGAPQQGGGPQRSKGPDPAAALRAAQAKAAAEAAAAMARAGNRFKSQAENLDPQIAALRQALDVSFKASLDQNLSDVGTLLTEQFDLLKQGASQRAKDFLEGAANTEKATAGQAEGSFSNLIRERQDSMTNLLEHGAGETDMLRSMVMAARNWHSNTNEGNRAYFDSMQSTRAGITDLNVDTQSALSNVHNQTESERERLWQDFYNRRSETFTQLGNVYTQQADYLDMAKEQKVGEGGGSKKTLSGTAFMDASNEAGKSYQRQALPDWIKGYKAAEAPVAKVANTDLAAAMQFAPTEKAEGAGLRSWG